MAIAFESANNGTFNASSTDVSWTHTTAGNNQCLVIFGRGNTGSAANLTCTVDGSAATIITRIDGLSTNGFIGLFYVTGLSAAAHTIHILNAGAANQLEGCSVNYTGVNTLDASNSKTAAASQDTAISVTTIANNSWAVCGAFVQGDTLTAGASTTRRAITTDNSAIFDGNAAVTPPGSTTLNVHATAADNFAGIIASFSPTIATVTHNLTVLGCGS